MIKLGTGVGQGYCTRRRPEIFVEGSDADRMLPALPFEIEKVSYLDGSKVCFANGG